MTILAPSATGEGDVRSNREVRIGLAVFAAADTDDDGLSDYAEVRVTHTMPGRFDSDGDGLSDGVELGVTKPVADPPGAALGTKLAKFRKDLDPTTKTKPKRRDTDGDGRSDGSEDKNHNGRRDEGETNPLQPD